MGTDKGQIELCARQIYLSVPPDLAVEIAFILDQAYKNALSSDGVAFMDKLCDALKARIKKEAEDDGE